MTGTFVRAIAAGVVFVLLVSTVGEPDARAGSEADAPPETGAIAFAVFTSDTAAEADRAAVALRAIDDSPARFVVQFESGGPASRACGDDAIEHRRALLDASAKPVVPIANVSEWATCDASGGDPFERLQRLVDAFFGSDESLGRTRMSWSRQSVLPRFRRYRENLRWQAGRVLFATVDLAANNNDYRIGAGRNGEFEERVVANRAWLERTFRIATERRLPAVVIFVDAAPRFSVPLRAPDPRTRERDGYYEWKIAMRELVPTFRGRVLLVQGRYADDRPRPQPLDHPLRDAAGRPIENLYRIAAPASEDGGWMRIDVEPSIATPFRASIERVFDDPSGELYGPGRVR